MYEKCLLTQASFSQKNKLGNQRVMGLIPIRDSEVYFSEKKKLVSTQTFHL